MTTTWVTVGDALGPRWQLPRIHTVGVRSGIRALSRSFPWAAPELRDFPPDGLRPAGVYSTLFFEHRGRPCIKWHHYFPIYDQLFGPWRAESRPEPTRPVRFLEIGVFDGGSLEIWRKFFGPDAVITGIDIDERCADLSRPDLPIRIGDQSDPTFLANVVEEMGGVDIILDDGSHRAKDQRASFDCLFPLLDDGGVYVIEDTHTSYWAGHQGGLRRPGTAVQMAKALVDGMHKWYFHAPVGRRASRAKHSIQSITFFDSVIAIHKASQVRPQVSTTGRTSPDGQVG